MDIIKKRRNKNSSHILFSLFLLSLFFVLTSNVEAASKAPKLFNATTATVGGASAMAPSIGGNIPVEVNFDNFSPENSQHPKVIEAEFEGNVYQIIKQKIVKRGEGNYTWFGHVKDVPNSVVILTVVDGYLRGRIDIGENGYVLAPVNGQYVVAKEDHAKAIKFGDDFINLGQQGAATSHNNSAIIPPTAAADSGSNIDVLVVYTSALYTKYGSTLASMIQNYVDIANTAYTNSGISTQITVVHSEQYSNSSSVIASSTTISNALTSIAADTSLATLRTTYGADLVALLRIYDGAGGACGLAYIGAPSGAYSSYAYSVTDVKPLSEANGGYYCYDTTFVHELGHNMGCAHDRANANSPGAYSYSYGYGISGTFGTIMSYLSPVINYFSTPNKTVNGNVIGTSTDDNVTTINNMKSVIAGYKDSVSTSTTTVSAPTNVSGSSSGTSVTLTWNASSGASGYKIYYGTSSGSYLGSVDVGNVTSKSFSGVGSGTYYLAIKAYTTSGFTSTESTSYSSEVSVTVSSSTTTLAAPTSVTASANGTTVTISWVAGSGASGYKLYYGTSSGSYLNASTGLDLGNVTSKTFTGIGAGTYYLALKSYDSSGTLSSLSSEVTVTVSSSTTTSSGCTNTLSSSGTVTGTLDSSCTSGDGTGTYAKFYTFTLTSTSTVTISMSSTNADAYIYLRNGSSSSGTVLYRDDDSGTGSNAYISQSLGAGTYTIDATIYRNVTGADYTLTVSGI